MHTVASIYDAKMRNWCSCTMLLHFLQCIITSLDSMVQCTASCYMHGQAYLLLRQWCRWAPSVSTQSHHMSLNIDCGTKAKSEPMVTNSSKAVSASSKVRPLAIGRAWGGEKHYKCTQLRTAQSWQDNDSTQSSIASNSCLFVYSPAWLYAFPSTFYQYIQGALIHWCPCLLN